MTAGKNIKDEIDAQKAMVSRLKEEIFGEDKSGASPYIREFLHEFRAFRKVCDIEDVFRKAMQSDVIYFGDYHPLGASQKWALSLISELTGRGAKVVLAMEMLYAYQQESLDRYMKETYSEEEFLRMIDYESEWGFDWLDYRPLFLAAKDPFVPIFGIDSPPRDQLKFIAERDVMMGKKIASIMDFFPHHKIVVFVGESHLATGHLPEEVKKACREKGAAAPEETVIVQNIDDIYWKLMEKGIEESSAVDVGKGRYCIFTASPMLKYQSYRDMIAIWSEHSISESVLTSLGEMVENILILLGEKGESGRMEEIFPEVVRRKTYDAIASFMRSEGVSEEGVLSAVEMLRDSGIGYFPGLNLLLLVKFDRACAAREAARFVVRALRGETGAGSRIEREESDRFYAYIFEEALAWVGGRLVDPPLNALDHDDLSASMDAGGVVRRSVAGLSISRTRYLAGLLRYHRKREKLALIRMRKAAARKSSRRPGSGPATLRVTKGLREIFALDIRERQLVIRALGRSLGNAIYTAFHEGAITKEDLASIFSEKFDSRGRGARLYLRYLHAVSS